ncbi:MAG: BCCT family transporter, partial [Yaniella sp.]|nr:BCCT family transporter [Yaniella sp.]
MAERPPSEDDSIKEDAKRVGRQAGKSVGSWDYSRPIYPHNIHPALVPGISLDEQRRKYSVDKIVFAVAGVLAVAFVIWGLISPENVGVVANAAYGWVTTNLSWLFSAVATIVLFSLLALAFTRYGRIPLGKDGEKPEFST